MQSTSCKDIFPLRGREFGAIQRESILSGGIRSCFFWDSGYGIMSDKLVENFTDPSKHWIFAWCGTVCQSPWIVQDES